MDQASAMFSFLAEATSPDNSSERHELIVFVRAISQASAAEIFRERLAETGWTFPEVKEVAEISGNMKMSKLEKLDLEGAIRAAARDGAAIVVFNNSSK